MELIDNIRAEIERRKNTAETMRERGAYIGLLDFLDTLPEEQPASEDLEQEFKRKLFEALYYTDGEGLGREKVMKFADEVATDLLAIAEEHFRDATKKMQPSENIGHSGDLEEEVKKYWNAHALDYRIGKVADIDFLQLTARHFYELGRKIRK